MEAAAHFANFSKLFRLIRRASGKQLTPETNLRDASGHLISDLDEKIDRWATYLQQLLNRPSNQSMDLEPPSTVEPYNIICSSTTEQEISEAIDRLKNGKFPGADGIPAEIYEVCKSVLLKPLQQLFTAIWETEMFPYD